MIRLDISAALFFYLFFNVIVVLLLWVFCGYKRKGMSIEKDKDYIWHCPICANTYIDSIDELMSKCPRCGSYNKRNAESQVT